MANCHDLFSAFYDVIALSEANKEKLRQARDAVRVRIKAKFKDAGRVPVPDSAAQGSFVMNTTVNPIDGEYDLDDGVYLMHLDKTSNADWPTPETAHKWVYDAVDGHTDQRPIDKRTCVRLVYAGQYHLDLPIYAQLNGVILHAEKGEKGWHKSDAQAITDWFKKAVDTHGDQLRRMVRYFKAWADYNSKDGVLPSGLVLSVLLVEKFVQHERDDVCFGSLASALYSRMLSNQCVYNPADTVEREDFCARYDNVQKQRFIDALRRLKNAAADALTDESKKASCKKWRGEFGDRWTDCGGLEDKDTARYTKAPAVLRDDARSA